jgi:glycosyltransferase involved in cell wall biosynthesis
MIMTTTHPTPPHFQPHATPRTVQLARAWHLRGNLDRAIAGYRTVIAQQPEYAQAYHLLGGIFIRERRFEEARKIYCQGLSVHPNNAEFHKQLINVLIATDGLDAAFDYYDLRPIHNVPLEITPNTILGCIVVRNERLRLPYLLAYYRRLGVEQFLIVDNSSTDGTIDYLSVQKDVAIWQSDRSFNQANFGSAWFELLLQKHGIDHWCLTLDADEIFYYPNCETRSIQQLCADLDRDYKRAFTAILLDMYSERPIQETHYQTGQDLLQVCPYFDRQFYHSKVENSEPFPYQNQTRYVGGMRERVFGKQGDYYLNKVPLIKYQTDMVLSGGQHHIGTQSNQISDETGALLHFKYISTFTHYVATEVQRKEHHGDAFQYRQYASKLSTNAPLTLYDPVASVRLQNSEQLVELGIMQAAKPVTPWVRNPAQPLHILLYTDCVGIYGAGQWNHVLLMALQDQGYQVSCVQYQFADPLLQSREKVGIPHHWIPTNNLITIELNELNNWVDASQLLRTVHPDLILFSHGEPHSNLAATEVAQDMGIPYITVIHAVTENWAIQFEDYLDRIVKACTQAQAVITVSQENLNLLHRYFRLSSDIGQVIYNGRPDRYFQRPNQERRQQFRREWGIPNHGIICMTTARLDSCKGYQYQVMAMPQLQSEGIFERLYFVWAGKGKVDDRLKKMVQDLGVSDRVHFLGERFDIPDLLDAADIFILPSQYEGMPLAIMEAMAKGLPVIASAVSGIPEELGNTGVLLPDPKFDSQATIDALAQTLTDWVRHPERLPELGQACKARAIDFFREDIMMEQYFNLIEQTLSKTSQEDAA